MENLYCFSGVDISELAQVWINHKMHGGCIYGDSRTVMIVTVVVVRHEYNVSGGAGKKEMVSDAHVWRNI